MTTDLDVVAKDVWDVVGGLELPMLLVELEGFTVSDATPAFFREIGVAPSSVLNRPIYDLYSERDRVSAQVAMRALADGLIDFYSARRQLALPGGRVIDVVAWARAIQFGDCQYALAQCSASPEPRNSPLVEYLGYSPLKVAVGMTDANDIITAVSKNVVDIVGETSDVLIGRRLLNDHDQRRLREELNTLGDDGSLTMSLPIRLNGLAPKSHSVRCIITCLAESTSRCFLLLSGPDPSGASRADRVAQLEHRLWRIASEVQASGIFESLGAFPDPERFPQLNTLNTRQWEVLSRLLRGERVPAIAKALFVSPSTIRNNLSDVFKIFDVHSQSELLSLLNS